MLSEVISFGDSNMNFIIKNDTNSNIIKSYLWIRRANEWGVGVTPP